ncbi:ShlB/FhaC/HecB family hemolysin secretion/activation protein [Roseovarius sp. EL26]|uniref:ShlB/FhaC/HecB family hemolysin secretion/activation protein n=1 Tax=Roseovarius sp. EL26 TaxID=2126672 RepID=UPI000EA0D0D6|nr:ShlB/FhaC/HecB family hemolysin secretion/activation protein [Roseovarius sp. EL26]
MALLRLSIILVLFVLQTSIVRAQEQDAGRRILEEQQRRERFEELERATTGQEITTQETGGVVVEAVCFPIEDIKLTGVTLFSDSDFAPIINRYNKQCLGQASISNLLQDLSAYYADRGYITTRAYVPAQDVSQKKLKIDVLEGRIEAFVYNRVDKDGKPIKAPVRKLKFAFPAKEGDVFQLRDIEHGLEQINRLSSSRASANLSAGEEPGTSQVVVTEQKVDTVRASIGIDNQGTEEGAEAQLRLNLAVDDLLRVNDTFNLSYSGSRNSNAIAFSGSVPYRKWLFSASASYSESLESLSLFSDLFTQTASANLRAERLLFRNERSKYYAYGAVSRYWNERFVNIAALIPQNRSAFSVGFRNEHRLEKSLIAADTSLTFGSSAFGSDRDPENPVFGTPRVEYTKLETSLNYIRPFEKGHQLVVSFTGQMSDQPLFSEEQISIGGWNSVRGYNGFSISGDTGFYIRTELQSKASSIDIRKWGKPLEDAKLWSPVGKAQGGARSFIFMDLGYVFSKPLRREFKMASVGAGMNLEVGRWTIGGTLAAPLVDQGGQRYGEFQALLSASYDLF